MTDEELSAEYEKWEERPMWYLWKIANVELTFEAKCFVLALGFVLWASIVYQ